MAAAFDLGMMLNTAPSANMVQQIACDLLTPYHNHMFALYDGERLEDMVESIRKNGVLTPLIVQPLSGGKYEILIGHNRWNASKAAGLATVPAIVKQGLPADEAEMYVIESNIMQRGFDNLRISEQAAVVAQRHEAMFSQGKRNDIIRELKLLENPNLESELTETPSQTTRDKVGSEYGLSGKTVSRLIRINRLIDELKEQIDNENIAFLAGVQLSYLSDDTQETVALLAEQYKISIKKAEELRKNASDGSLSDKEVEQILSGKTDEPQQPKPKSVKISQASYSRYFSKKATSEEVSEIIEKALEMYFMNQDDDTDKSKVIATFPDFDKEQAR